MSYKNGRICRLCLKVAKNEFQEINEVVKELLGVLLLKLDLDVTRNPIICEDCMEVAKKCLDFKSTCIDTEKIIVLFSTDRKKTRHRIRDIYEEREKVMKAMDAHLDICRFCLTLLDRNNCMSMDSLMDETMFQMFSEYLPETDLNVIENPIICRICRENLDSYFMFVTNCVDTEGKIKTYCKEGTDSTGDVTLSNSLHFLFRYTLQDPEKCYRTYKVKEEPNTFEDIDLVRHEPHNKLMKLEEELNIEEGINFTENLSEKMLDKHGDTFYSNQLDKDTKPDIFAKRKANLNNHMSVHKNISKMKMYKCSLCSYEFKHNAWLIRHMLVHKDVSEVKMFKCSFCSFETKHKSNLNVHMLIHADISKIKMKKCSLCTFQTKHQSSLRNHMPIHKNISEIKTYKCSFCTYEAKRKYTLKNHVSVHKDISEIKTYKCSLCAYEFKHNAKLLRHMLVHKDVSEVKMYKCLLCTFQTKHKSSLRNHMPIHKDISEIKTYKCSLCTYEAKLKYNLKNHMAVHKDISEIRAYECSLCTCEYKRKSSLTRHMIVHRDVSGVKK